MANAHGLNAWPAVATIARETSLTTRAVQKVLRRLLTKGFVSVDSTRRPIGRLRHRHGRA